MIKTTTMTTRTTMTTMMMFVVVIPAVRVVVEVEVAGWTEGWETTMHQIRTMTSNTQVFTPVDITARDF